MSGLGTDLVRMPRVRALSTIAFIPGGGRAGDSSAQFTLGDNEALSMSTADARPCLTLSHST